MGRFSTFAPAIGLPRPQDLALATVAGINEEPLTGIPVVSSIEVYVDGVRWTTDWHYDASTQSVVFDVAMDSGEDDDHLRANSMVD